jgi:uncharacterized membrane protein (UPF0182 family)
MHLFPEARSRSEARVPGLLIVGGAVVLLLLFGAGAIDFATEWQWFESLGLTSVLLISVSTRIVLFVVGAALFLALFATNVVVARRVAYGLDTAPRGGGLGRSWEDLLAQVSAQMVRRGEYARYINGAVLAGGALLALFMGLSAAANWLTVLQFIHRRGFGITDPALGQDVGFYLFTMPLLRSLEGWLFSAFILTVLSSVAVYAIVLTYELAVNIGQIGFRLTRGLKAHILTLAAVLFALFALHHLLDLFDIVRSTRGAVYGAGYTDVFAQRPAQIVLTVVAVLAAASCLVNVALPGVRLAAIGAAVWFAALILVGGLFPAFVQNVDVAPNELERERQYIDANIRFTRHAFGLDRIESRDVAYEDVVSPGAVSNDRATVENIRLWDHRPLLSTYNQIQAIRQYYQFADVDVDRYTIDGRYQQVMVAARELVLDKLPASAQTWVSRQLTYTHGYGVAMSPVSEVSQEGLPSLVIRDVPPTGRIPISRPEIYFGEKSDHYIVIRTGTPEFDYPSGDQGVFVSRPTDAAGVGVGSLPQRFLYALKFQDANLLLNRDIQPDSQLLFRRNVQERARQIAPFLRLDPDPYIVVANGRLYWIQDAYTFSDRYPYAEPYQPPSPERGARRRPFNYIRNSVKIVTDAYDGTIRFYVADPTDPLIQAYAGIFPGLFVPQEQAPPEVQAHFRYPEELFRIQSQKYGLYHMEDPRVFYLKEDVWTVPNEIFDKNIQPVDPYYVIMELPGENRPEFILMQPFAPRDRHNMIGWLAARSDQPNYGKMLVIKYPKDKLIYGPFQIETRVDQDPVISQQFALWNQAGTQVIRGNLLVIPLGQSNLYVEPIYLQATASPLPELRRVVLAMGNSVVMEPTLQDSLARLFGAAAGPPGAPAAAPNAGAPGAAQPGIPSATVASLAREAQDRYTRAQEALRNGDFARYGEELRALEAVITRLVQITGQP